MHGNALTFSEQVIADIIYDSRGGMSDVAFRTAPPIGRHSSLRDLFVDDEVLFAVDGSTGQQQQRRRPLCSSEPIGSRREFPGSGLVNLGNVLVAATALSREGLIG